MSIYQSEYKILSSDTDMFQRLRISRLLTLLQEMAIAHTEALGAGRAKTLDRGYLWAVALQQVKITSMPLYDQNIKLFSAPGEIMHTFFPRQYFISDENGNELVSGSAMWVLMNKKTRALESPQKAGVFVPAESNIFWQSFFPAMPKLASGEEISFEVPYSYTDLNTHMNNTRYFDLAEDIMSGSLRRRQLQALSIEYSSEISVGDKVTLIKQEKTEEFLLCGKKNDKRIFRLSLKYK